MNWYATLNDVKTRLNISGTAQDADLTTLIEEVSREIDRHCARHFYVWEGVKYLDGRATVNLLVPDVLSVSEVAIDTELDGTYDGETWSEGTDFYLRPDNAWPKRFIWLPPWGDKTLLNAPRYVKVTGAWGFGDEESATPYEASGLTGTVADATTTEITASADASSTIYAGHTLRIESEQVFVTAVSGTAITVQRGVNGTTAAAHSSAAMSTYRYPPFINKACKELCHLGLLEAQTRGLMMRQIGAYMEQFMDTEKVRKAKDRMLYLYVDKRIRGSAA